MTLVECHLLLSKESADPPQHTVLLWVVGVVFAGDFEDCGEGSGIGFDTIAYSVGNLLYVSP